MFHVVIRILLLLLAVSVIIAPVAAAEEKSTTVSLSFPSSPQSPADIESEILITASEAIILSGGYTVNGDFNPERVVLDGSGGSFLIKTVYLPPDTTLEITVTYNGVGGTDYYDFIELFVPLHYHPMSIQVDLDFHTKSPVTPDSPDSPDTPVTPSDPDSPDSPDTPVTPSDPDSPDSPDTPVTPGNPDSPDSPDTPVTPGNPDSPDGPDTPVTPSDPDSPDSPDTPVTPGTPNTPVTPGTPDVPVNPDTPVNPSTPVTPDTPSTPGTDEPYIPILPPAGSVHNVAGFIPLAAGILLLFLVFFWKRKVYRILKSHAKKHGEKPEKEHLKEIADAIIKLVRDDGRYPEWKKNSDVAKRLSADIVSVLDEMNYARAVPRGALVAEILKAAKGRINRHRL